MTREELLGQLIRMRELQLKGQTAELKSRNGVLANIERALDQVQSAAVDSIGSVAHLRDLGALGDMRLGYKRLAATVQDQVRTLANKVIHSRKLTDAARDAVADIKRARDQEQERSLENEAEHFFSWQSDSKRER
ncbi:MAG TPA: hypothetical protein VMA09_19310 [Candidatus Binataceae bacterium]|nr:hypothetical protein [Candidatus Binataceae bacterium]